MKTLMVVGALIYTIGATVVAWHYAVSDGRLHCTVENPFNNHWKHNQL